MSKLKGENSIISKQHNRGLVFKLIVTGQCKSRIEISRMTGLLPAGADDDGAV